MKLDFYYRSKKSWRRNVQTI